MLAQFPSDPHGTIDSRAYGSHRDEGEHRNQHRAGHSTLLFSRASFPLYEFLDGLTRILEIVLVVQQALDVLGTQLSEPVDDALSAFVSVRGRAVHPFDHPTGPGVVLKSRALLSLLGAAG